MNHAKIKIGGENRVIRFGLKTLGDCVEHYDDDIQAFLKALEKNPFKSIPLLFYYGLKWGSEEKGEVFDHDMNTIFSWIEDLPEKISDDVVTKVVQMFIRSVYENVPAVKEYIDGEEEETKKNLIGA